MGAHRVGWPTFVSDQYRMHLRSQPSLQVVNECSALHVEHVELGKCRELAIIYV